MEYVGTLAYFWFLLAQTSSVDLQPGNGRHATSQSVDGIGDVIPAGRSGNDIGH